MKSIHRYILASSVTILLLTAFYIVLWIVDIGGLGGMMGDDSYPISMILLPLVALTFSTIAFIIGICLPALLFWRIEVWTRLSRGWAILGALCLSTLIGGIFGFDGGSANAMLIYAFYLAAGQAVFSLARLPKGVKSTVDG